jgi:uncharacterized membrane protein YebE (DUF533 family)
MDESKFQLWRASFAFCFLDGILDEKEKLWIQDKMTSLPFNENQKQQLLKELKNPPALVNILPLITKPADRGFLINHIRFLASLDKVITKQEKAKIENLLQQVFKQIDEAQLMNQLSAWEKDHLARLNSESLQSPHKHSFLERLINQLLK